MLASSVNMGAYVSIDNEADREALYDGVNNVQFSDANSDGIVIDEDYLVSHSGCNVITSRHMDDNEKFKVVGVVDSPASSQIKDPAQNRASSYADNCPPHHLRTTADVRTNPNESASSQPQLSHVTDKHNTGNFGATGGVDWEKHLPHRTPLQSTSNENKQASDNPNNNHSSGANFEPVNPEPSIKVNTNQNIFEEFTYTKAPLFPEHLPPLNSVDAFFSDPVQNIMSTSYSNFPSVAQEDYENMSKEELIHCIHKLNRKVAIWESIGADFVHPLILGPQMTAFYASLLREALTTALLKLPEVEKILSVECSFPSIKREAPRLSVLRWLGLDYGEFEVDWAPRSWWVTLSIIASQSPVPARFNVFLTIKNLRLHGSLKVALARDVGSCRIGLLEKPKIEADISSKLIWGKVPLPVQVSFEELVHSQLQTFFQNTLVEKSREIPIRRTVKQMFNDHDYKLAMEAAERASGFKFV